MQNKLRNYFPMIKTRDEVMAVINDTPRLRKKFMGWPENARKEFLSFCTGAKGMKVLYDAFFKEVFNAEYDSGRLDDLLSEIMMMKVHIIKVLPTDSTRLGDETRFVSMDIIVETEDGSIINVEIQKVGYMFPGERSACYSADLLLRQYKRLRDLNKKKFKYGDIMPVYTIVFFENSPIVFSNYPKEYIHRFKQVSDTGLELELLQKYIFIPLDIFKEISHNKPKSKIDAWLTFLSSDEVEDILYLIEHYPEFKPLYETLYIMCQNIEGVMDMFSPELYEMDRNTAEFMVDEYARMVKERDEALVEKDALIAEHENTIAEKDNTIAELKRMLAQLQNENQ